MRWIMTALICGWFASAFAGEPIGKVAFIEGVADILRQDGTLLTLQEGQEIELKDRIRTKSYSKTRIVLADESVLKLAPSSCVSIDEFSISSSGLRERCVVYLSRGKAEAVVAKTGAPDTFIIETPNARGAVKGSDIFVSYLAGRTGMYVKQGAMSVINPLFPEARQVLNRGSCVFVPLENPPDLPRQAMKSEMLIHERDVSPELIRKWVPSDGSSMMNAVIVALSGTVRIYKKSADDWSAAVNEEVLEEGDTLQTGEDGRVEIRLGNGNSLSLEPSTELVFRSLRYDPDSGSFHNEFEVTEGEVFAMVEKISGESTFKVRTPTALAGVRGTLMRIVVEPPRADMPVAQTQVFFEGGRGDVMSIETGVTQQIMPGQNVRVDAVGVISQPVVTAPAQRSTMLEAVAQKQAGQFLGPKGFKEGFMPLPPPPGSEGLPPPPPPPPGGETVLPPPPPPYDQINPDIWYRAPLAIQTVDPTTITLIPTKINEISLKTDGTWNAIFNGAYPTGGGIPLYWDLRLNNSSSGDYVSFNDIPVEIASSATDRIQATVQPGGFSGEVKGTDVDRTLALGDMTVVIEPLQPDGHIVVDARGTYNPL